MDASFPPAARLHHGRDYSRVFNHRQKAAGRHVVVLVRPHDRPGGRARLGIMIAAKTVSAAVERHRFKRWVRELFRLRLQHVLQKHDSVVLFRSAPASHAELDNEIIALTERALRTRRDPGGGGGGRGGHRHGANAGASGQRR